MASLTEGKNAQEENRAGGVQTSDSVWAAEGGTSAFKKALNPTFDTYRSEETDENLSPNGQFFRESTPEANDIIALPPGSWSKPYSPRSNPFGERPSQRTPGARSFIRRLSTHSSLSGGDVTDCMAETSGREGENVWLSTPEVSTQEVKASWDAVGRIEKLLDDQAKANTEEDESIPQPDDMTLTWTGTQVNTESPAGDGSAWRQRVANSAFQGTPSPSSSRASSLSGGEALGSVQRRRSTQGSTPLGQRTPEAVPEESGTPDSQSAETFPRSFRIQRSGSADSLASMLSHTSDITGRESSFERERNALRDRQMETILEPGETPLRNAEGNASDRRGLFARSADGGMSVLATPRREPGGGADQAGSPPSARSKEWLAGLGTPCSASCASPSVQKAEGAFASPIEVHETVEFTLPPVSAEAQALPVSPIEVQETVEVTLPPPSAEAQALPGSLIEVQETVEVTLPPPSAEAQALPKSPIKVQETVEFALPPPSAEAQAVPAPVAREAPTPFVGLREPAPLTPVIDEAHALHAKGDRKKAVATPFVKLREPAPLTPVIQRAATLHAQVKTATAGEGSGYWPLVQLLLIVTTLAGVVLLPSLTAHLPHFNAHILPSMPHTARHQTSEAAMFPILPEHSWSGKAWTDVRNLIWKPAEKHGKSSSDTVGGMIKGIFHQDSHGAEHNYLGKPSAQPPTPNLDRLVGTVSAWWAHTAAQLPHGVINRLPKSMQPPKPKAKASSSIEKATGAAFEAAEHAKASIQNFVHTVQHSILPKAEPVEEGSKSGTLKPKIQAAPVPSPPTLAKKASAAQKQAIKEGEKAVEQARHSAEAVKEKASAAAHNAAAAAEQGRAAAQAKAADATSEASHELQRAKSGATDAAIRVSEGLQRAKSGAGEKLGLVSEKLSDMAHKVGSEAAKQARQAAVPIQAAAHRTRSAIMRSAHHSAGAMHSVMDRAKQGVSDHPQGILAGAAITVLLGILAGLLTLIARPSPSVEIDTVEVEEVDVLGSPIAPMASIDTPVTVFTKLPVRRSRLGVTEMPTTPRTGVQQRALPSVSMPPTSPWPAPSTARRARAAHTAPVGSSKLLDIVSTADTPLLDTPAARTRSRARRAAN